MTPPPTPARPPADPEAPGVGRLDAEQLASIWTHAEMALENPAHEFAIGPALALRLKATPSASRAAVAMQWTLGDLAHVVCGVLPGPCDDTCKRVAQALLDAYPSPLEPADSIRVSDLPCNQCGSEGWGDPCTCGMTPEQKAAALAAKESR